MPSIAGILRSRRKRAVRRPALTGWGVAAAGIVSLALALGGAAAAWFYSQATADLPPVQRLASLLDPPNGQLLTPSRLLDRRGQQPILILANPNGPRAQQPWQDWYLWQPPDGDSSRPRLPQTVISTTLAAQDPGFFQHNGWTLAGLSSAQPGTLAERLAVDYLLSSEPPSPRRALRQRILAAQATQIYGRDKILEWTVNHADYGRLTYGVESAAWVYFDKPATQLSLAEAALLAGVAANPRYNPIEAPKSALEQQKYVLQAMLRSHLADPNAIAAAAAEKLTFRPNPRPGASLSLAELAPQAVTAYSPFPQLVLQQLAGRLPLPRLGRGGYQVLTTFDLDLFNQAKCAAQHQLTALVGPAGSATGCPAAQLLPALPPLAEASAGEAGDAPLMAEVVILDPVTGQVLAALGDPTAAPESIFPAHPTGTITTPFTFLTAFSRGYSPATLLWDIPPDLQVDEGLTTTQRLANIDDQYSGPMRLRLAAANDYNAPADSVLEQVGADNVLRSAAQFGLRAPEAASSLIAAVHPSHLSLYRPMDLLEVSAAYAIFANNGVQAGHWQQDAGETTISAAAALRPSAILAVTDSLGQTVWDGRVAQTRPIITPSLAYLINHVLSDESARWPSLGHPNPTETGRPAAVKFGRTLPGDSHWIIGYTPEMVIGVWIGAPTGSPRPPAPAPADRLRLGAAGLWHALVQTAFRNQTSRQWEMPSGVRQVKVCDPSGMLPTRDCPTVVEEVFLDGSQPLQADRLFQRIAINRDSGRRATVFTSPDLIEEKPFFLPPAFAAPWARSAHLPVPPDTYDVIPLNLPQAANAVITQPQPFAVVRGLVRIEGRAAFTASLSEDASPMAFYRVQVGQGLNPQTWLLVGQDQPKAQPGGQLSIWDTTGLDGLYALQLVLAQEDGSVQRATTIVRVDNQAPQVEFISPLAGETISASQRPTVVLLAEIHDDLGLEDVTFILDGETLGRLSQAPYALAWTPTLGGHTLEVRVTDLAGNQAQTTIQFEVIK